MAVIPATVVLAETNGAGAVITNGITGLGFGTVDAPNLNSALFPLTVTSATNTSTPGVSFKKWLRAYVTWATPTGGDTNTHTVSAFQFYCSSNPGNGAHYGTALFQPPYWGIRDSSYAVQLVNGSGQPNNWIPYQTPDTVLGFSIVGTANGSPHTFTLNATLSYGFIQTAPMQNASNPAVTIGGLDAGTIYSAGNSGTLAAPAYSNYIMYQMAYVIGIITPPGTLSLSGSGGAPVIAYQWTES